LVGTIVLNGIVALFAWGLAELVLYPARGGRAVTPIWPPVGLAVALTYIGGFRVLPGIVLGSLALGLRYNAWPLAILLALAQVVQPIVDIRIMKALGFDPKLERVRDPIALSLIAGPVGSFLAALLAVFLYFAFGSRPIDALPYDFMLWWLRDWLGVMVTTPLIFAWVYGRPTVWSWPRAGEAVALFLTLFAGSQLMFGLWGVFATRDVPIAFIFFRSSAERARSARAARRRSWRCSRRSRSRSPAWASAFSAFPIEFTQFLLFSFSRSDRSAA
jgi:integral membrane sensor domain MASE1